MEEESLQLKQLKRLVESLTTSGKTSLNEEQLKALKKICKSSDEYVVELFHRVMKQLKKKHAEIRLSAFQICNEIFLRSHCFRELVVKNFRKIIELTVINNSKSNHLQPFQAAKTLRTSAIQAFHVWYEKFGEGYVALKLGYKYLKECKNVDFESLAVVTEQDRRRREEERRKEEEVRNKKIKKVVDDMNNNCTDILNIILEFNTTFKLLIPDLDNFFISLENEHNDCIKGLVKESDNEYMTDENYEYGSDLMREHGLNKETSIQVNLSSIHKIQETPSNEVIIATIKEQISNIKRNILPKVKQWENSMMQYSSSEQELMRKIIDVKRPLEAIISRYESVTIMPKMDEKEPLKKSGDVNSGIISSDEDDDDFIDVPFDDPRVVQATASEEALLGVDSSLKEKVKITKIDPADLMAAGSSGVQNSKLAKSKVKVTDSSIENFLQDVPKDSIKINNSITGLSSIWSGNEALHDHADNLIKSSDILGIATCPINFEREWQPVRWECRAPLPSGRLCPRRDRECCPFHGPIIPRDSLGTPVRPEDAERERKKKEEYERAHPEWQNPTLLAEIKATTGVDLDMKKAKKRKKKYCNLTDLKEIENTPAKRLQKKIFNKKSLKRINNSLAKLPQ